VAAHCLMVLEEGYKGGWVALGRGIQACERRQTAQCGLDWNAGSGIGAPCLMPSFEKSEMSICCCFEA